MNKKELKAVIFDMDGVITDTMPFHYLANKKIADELNIPFDEKENEKFRGISRTDIIKTFVKKANLQLTPLEIKELSDRKNKYYKEHLKNIDDNFLLPGILDFIKELKESRLKLAIASSSTNARFILEKTGIINYFDFIVDASKLKKGKPNPEIFLTAADSLNVDYRDCIAIEDGKAGLVAIKHTPMYSIGIGEVEFMKYADWNVSSAKDLHLKELKKRFENHKKYAIGLDGGGTYIRTNLIDEDGNVLSSIKSKGGASPIKNINAKSNVKNAIIETVNQANLSISDISSVVCGIADLNNEKDLEWAETFTDIEGLTCPRFHFNDTIIAGRGAFLEGIGIVVITGTGSMVTAFNEKGEVINNRSYANHDARAGAVKLSSDLLFELKKDNYNQTDEKLIEDLQIYFNVSSMEELKNKIINEIPNQKAELLAQIGGMSKYITKYAKEGSELARYCSERAMKNLKDGVEIVSEIFISENINVALIGSIINDDYMNHLFKFKMSKTEKNYTFQKPIFEPEFGAALLALEKINYDTSKLETLKRKK